MPRSKHDRKGEATSAVAASAVVSTGAQGTKPLAWSSWRGAGETTGGVAVRSDDTQQRREPHMAGADNCPVGTCLHPQQRCCAPAASMATVNGVQLKPRISNIAAASNFFIMNRTLQSRPTRAVWSVTAVTRSCGNQSPSLGRSLLRLFRACAFVAAHIHRRHRIKVLVSGKHGDVAERWSRHRVAIDLHCRPTFLMTVDVISR